MNGTVSVFQLGSSTVVTLPKKLGFKPGTKLEYKKTRQGLTLKLDKKKNLLEILEENRGAWVGGTDWEDYLKRRKFEIKAAKRMRKAW